MARWGMPKRFRVDNGFPWGSSGDLPPDLALWLIGLGIEITWNPPRRPQKNGVVERSQGVGKRWSEPKQCDSSDKLQARVDEMDRLQREDYPRQKGRSRMELFPALRHSGRPYDAGRELACWQWQRMGQHLTGYTAARRVDKGGLISLYNRNVYVGTKYRGQTVYVTLDPQTREWIFSDERGTQLRTRAAIELETDCVIRLEVTNRRGRTKSSRTKAQPGVP